MSLTFVPRPDDTETIVLVICNLGNDIDFEINSIARSSNFLI